MSTPTHAELRKSILMMLDAYPAQSNLSDTFDAYLAILHDSDISVEFTILAIRKILRGDVPGLNPNYRPAPAVIVGIAREEQAKDEFEASASGQGAKVFVLYQTDIWKRIMMVKNVSDWCTTTSVAEGRSKTGWWFERHIVAQATQALEYAK